MILCDHGVFYCKETAINPLLLTGLFDIGSKLINRFFPDEASQNAAKLELLKMQQSGELQLMANETNLALAQIEVNKAEAASGNAFASSWRPSVGYVCVMGLAYTFLIQPFLAWYSINNAMSAPPSLDMGTLITLLGGLLGLSGLRTTEKIKGVA